MLGILLSLSFGWMLTFVGFVGFFCHLMLFFYFGHVFV